LQHLAEAPPLAVYAIIAVSCVIENFFPPSPSDVFIALAAFLSQRGSYDPLTIFLVAWVSGVSGAVGVYAIARRGADGFSRSPIGRRLASPRALAAVERGYHRYGIAAMFVVRLLPAFRSVVAPFAGLYRLPPRRALVPIALASGTWYATLILVGMKVGSEWEAIRSFLDRLNTGLTFIAFAVGVLIVGVLLWRRRGKRKNAP
jgi:membrane protein DedA with SNARE-associated domain